MNRYNKLTMIGKGTFGSVWLVESKISGKKYAVKELSARTMSATDRHLALNEVKILSTLKHKNIIRYKDAFEESYNFYIVMECAEGGDLYSKIKQSKGLFKQEQILEWLTQLLLALKHIHGINILHRDLKTQNIFLTKSDVIKLGDFGIARILDSTTDHAQTTVGTPYYLSPEICEQQPYNQKSDMWALGCVMYEISSLVPPFTADCFSSLVVKILHGKYTPIPRIYGPLLQDLINVLLRTNPHERPSAKRLLYVPAMKPYVEKYAVIQRERTDSVASVASERKNSVEVSKTKSNPKSVASKISSVHIEKKTEKIFCENSAHPTDKDEQTSLVRPVKQREKTCECCKKQRVEVTVHQEPKPVSISSEKPLSRRQAEAKATTDKRTNISVVERQQIAVESTAADHIRQSILREHARRRRSSAASSTTSDRVEIHLQGINAKPKRKTGRIQSESAVHSSITSDKTETGSKQRKNDHRNLFKNEVRIKEPVPANHKGEEDDSQRRKSEAPTIVPCKYCDSKKHLKPSASIIKARPPEATHKTTITQQHSDAKNGCKPQDDDIQLALEVLAQNQPQKPTRKKMDDSQLVSRSRDRLASTPGVKEARARRQAARESLDQHMHHCRRVRKNSRRTASCENIDKENLYPMSKHRPGFKTVTKRKAVLPQPQAQDHSVMVNPSQAFKRCETYKVAQFRRLPLMSVPDATVCTDSAAASEPQCKSRHKSESSFLNPKLTDKFKGIRGVQIDKARRRAKKISTNIEVESSRSEFSIKPDSISTGQNKCSTLSYKAKQTVEQNPSNGPSNVPSNGPSNPSNGPSNGLSNPSNGPSNSSESKQNACEKEVSKLKFKFRGKTLHLNATDAKSTFAHIEALRVFLEQNLGTELFIEAYQHLNGSSLFTTSKEEPKPDASIKRILGSNKTDYLPLLYQLIASESNHFGTCV